MTFVTEQILEKDKQLIGFDKLTEHLGSGQRPSKWTIDTETGNFLLNVFWGSEDDRNGKKYWFSWGGHVIGVGAEWHERNESDGLIYFWRLLHRPSLASNLESKRIEMYAELQKAVTSDEQRSGAIYKRIVFTLA